MKKFLTLITILFSIFIGMQNINAQSVNIGYINSTYVISDSNAASQMTGNGMYGGFDYDYPVATNLLFNPGIFVDYIKYHLYGNLYGNVFYLRVPLHLKYSYRLDNMFELFGTAGPALSYALGGKIKYHDNGFSYTENFFDNSDQRFDIPLGLEIGANIDNSFKVTLGYDFGLINQAKDIDYRFTRNSFRVGVGYNF